jgi:hypothetical protein
MIRLVDFTAHFDMIAPVFPTLRSTVDFEFYGLIRINASRGSRFVAIKIRFRDTGETLRCKSFDRCLGLLSPSTEEIDGSKSLILQENLDPSRLDGGPS